MHKHLKMEKIRIYYITFPRKINSFLKLSKEKSNCLKSLEKE